MKDSFTFAGLGLTQLPTQLKCSQNAPDGTYGSLATKASKHIKVGCILRGMVLPVQYNWQPKFQRYLQNNHSEHRWKFEWTVEDAWSMPYSFDLLACAIFQTSFVPTSSYPALLACQYCQIMGKNTTHHSLPHFTFPKKPWSFPQIPRKVVQTSGFLSQQSLGTIFCILPKTPKTFNFGKKNLHCYSTIFCYLFLWLWSPWKCLPPARLVVLAPYLKFGNDFPADFWSNLCCERDGKITKKMYMISYGNQKKHHIRHVLS